MTSDNHIPEDDWDTIVQSMPIPSVDLIAKNDDGFVLGRRTNRPAKGLWFVPGGRIHKGEGMEDAVHRIAQQELGTDVTIEQKLGVYEHFYDNSDVGDEVPKHYIATGFVVTVPSQSFNLDDQHEEMKFFKDAPKGTHKYSIQYLQDSELLPF